MSREKSEPSRRVEGYIASSRVSSEVGRREERAVVFGRVVTLERVDEGCLAETAAPFRRVGPVDDIEMLTRRTESQDFRRSSR